VKSLQDKMAELPEDRRDAIEPAQRAKDCDFTKLIPGIQDMDLGELYLHLARTQKDVVSEDGTFEMRIRSGQLQVRTAERKHRKNRNECIHSTTPALEWLIDNFGSEV